MLFNFHNFIQYPFLNIPTSISIVSKVLWKNSILRDRHVTIYFHRMNTNRISQSMWVCLCVNEGECYIAGAKLKRYFKHYTRFKPLNSFLKKYQWFLLTDWILMFFSLSLYLRYWGWACKVILANMGLFFTILHTVVKYHHFKRRNCFSQGIRMDSSLEKHKH